MKKSFLKNNWRKIFLSVFVFIMLAGFLFLGAAKTSYAAYGGDVQDPFGLYDQTGQVAKISDEAQNKSGSCTFGSWFSYPLICALLALSEVVGFLLGASVVLFSKMVDVNYFTDIVRSPPIYLIWQKVRDLLNIAFILVLLFSAFATIFQVEKYSYKKILLRLIIMALLVNFSFPIARFIIDIANSLMYTLIRFLPDMSSDGGSAIFAKIAGDSKLAILGPEAYSASGLIVSVIFGFIMAITFLAVGVMMAIRLVALAILIIFSPVAFVGAILPSEDTGGIAGKWWGYLFRYAFFGPIMIFMIYIALEFVKIAGETGDWLQIANKNTISTQTNMVTAIAFTAIPVILLWMGIKVASSMSIAGAGAVTGFAQKVGKSTLLAPIRVGGWVTKKAAVATGVPGGVKQTWQELKRRGPLGSDAIARREAKVAGLFSTDAVVRDMKDRSKKYDDDKEHSDNLKGKCASGDAAACDRLVQRGDMNTETWQRFAKTNPNPKVLDSLTKDLKKNRLDLLIKHKWQDKAAMDVRVQKIVKTHLEENPNRVSELMKENPGWTEDQARTRIESEARSLAEYDVAKEEFGKLSPDKWNDQYWKDILDDNKSDIRITNALKKSFRSLSDQTQADIEKRLNANNASALRTAEVI